MSNDPYSLELDEAFQQIFTLQSMVRKLRAGLEIADARIVQQVQQIEKQKDLIEKQDASIATLKRELKSLKESLKSPVSRCQRGHIEHFNFVRSSLTADEIFQKVYAESCSFAALPHEDRFDVEEIFEENPVREIENPIGRVRGFPYRETRRPGVWSLKGLGLTNA